MAAAQGDVDLRPAVLGRLALGDHPVVGHPDEGRQRDDQNGDNHDRDHAATLSAGRLQTAQQPLGVGDEALDRVGLRIGEEQPRGLIGDRRERARRELRVRRLGPRPEARARAPPGSRPPRRARNRWLRAPAARAAAPGRPPDALAVAARREAARVRWLAARRRPTRAPTRRSLSASGFETGGGVVGVGLRGAGASQERTRGLGPHRLLAGIRARPRDRCCRLGAGGRGDDRPGGSSTTSGARSILNGWRAPTGAGSAA